MAGRRQVHATTGGLCQGQQCERLLKGLTGGSNFADAVFNRSNSCESPTRLSTSQRSSSSRIRAARGEDAAAQEGTTAPEEATGAVVGEAAAEAVVIGAVEQLLEGETRDIGRCVMIPSTRQPAGIFAGIQNTGKGAFGDL